MASQLQRAGYCQSRLWLQSSPVRVLSRYCPETSYPTGNLTLIFIISFSTRFAGQKAGAGVIFKRAVQFSKVEFNGRILGSSLAVQRSGGDCSSTDVRRTTEPIPLGFCAQIAPSPHWRLAGVAVNSAGVP